MKKRRKLLTVSRSNHRLLSVLRVWNLWELSQKLCWLQGNLWKSWIGWDTDSKFWKNSCDVVLTSILPVVIVDVFWPQEVRHGWGVSTGRSTVPPSWARTTPWPWGWGGSQGTGLCDAKCRSLLLDRGGYHGLTVMRCKRGKDQMCWTYVIC